MPLVKIEILQGKNREYKKALMDGIHNALVEALKIPDYDRNQRLHELKAENFEYIGTRTNRCTIIEITMFEGRTRAAKADLYTAICRNLEANPGIPAADVTIVINEVPLHNWGIRGGKPADEVDLGFEVKV
jgi:phenylpyruvate tautomerase PptA (4-oxalocrotonate tautomerase family)